MRTTHDVACPRVRIMCNHVRASSLCTCTFDFRTAYDSSLPSRFYACVRVHVCGLQGNSLLTLTRRSSKRSKSSTAQTSTGSMLDGWALENSTYRFRSGRKTTAKSIQTSSGSTVTTALLRITLLQRTLLHPRYSPSDWACGQSRGRCA